MATYSQVMPAGGIEGRLARMEEDLRRLGRASFLLAVGALATCALGGSRPAGAEDAKGDANKGTVLYFLVDRQRDPARESLLAARGRILQVDTTGKLLGRVELPYHTQGSMVLRRDGPAEDASAPWCLLTVVPFGYAVARVDASGRATLLYEDSKVAQFPSAGSGPPNPGGRLLTGLAILPRTGEILLSDQWEPAQGRLFSLKGWPPGDPGPVRDIPPKTYLLGVLKDDTALFEMNRDVYLGPLKAKPAQWRRVVTVPQKDFVKVGVNPGSNRWAVSFMVSGNVLVHEGSRQMLRAEIPPGRTAQSGPAFGTDGMPVVALGAPGAVEVATLDPATKSFRTLFHWSQEELQGLEPGWTPGTRLGLAVGPRMPWGGAAGPGAAPPGKELK